MEVLTASADVAKAPERQRNIRFTLLCDDFGNPLVLVQHLGDAILVAKAGEPKFDAYLTALGITRRTIVEKPA